MHVPSGHHVHAATRWTDHQEWHHMRTAIGQWKRQRFQMSIRRTRKKINRFVSISGVYCDERILTLKDSNDYAVCLQNVRDIKLSAESRRTWLSVVGGLLTFFIVFMGRFPENYLSRTATHNKWIFLFSFTATLFICHRRNVRATEKYLSRAKLQQVHTTENGKIEILLNDLSTTTTWAHSTNKIFEKPSYIMRLSSATACWPIESPSIHRIELYILTKY